MKVRASKSSSLLQDESEQLSWQYNGSLASILTISRSLGSILEYKASAFRAFTSYPTLGNKLSLKCHFVYADLKLTAVSHG